MELTQDDVIHILKLIDEAPMGRFSLQVGDLKLEVAKGSADRPLGLPRIASAPQLASEPVTVAVEKPAATSTTVSTSSGSSAPAKEGLVVIKAPLLGIFYLRPQPGAPLYVEVGTSVEESTTVALIEVMKLFNPVIAGVRGRIVRVCVENGSLVEHGQDLFHVEPE